MRNFIILFTLCTSCGFGLKSQAEAEAHSYVNELSLDPETKVSCVDTDSDGDGYVSCTLHTPGYPIEQIECYVPYRVFVLGNSSGCRAAKTFRARSN